MEIHWHHMEDLAEPERAAAEARLRALAEGRTDLIDVRITGRPSGHHRRGGHEVRITCQARGREIVATRTRPDLGLAAHDALDAFEQEVRRLRDRRLSRRTARAAEPPLLGIVDRVFPDEGYGFILTDAGDRVYFHRNAVHGALDFERLGDGERVGLDIEGGEKGLQAKTVFAPPPGAPAP